MKIVGKKPIVLTYIYSALMFLSIIVNITVYDCETRFTICNLKKLFLESKAVAGMSMFYMLTSILFIILIVAYGKTNLKMLLLPISCPIIITVVAALYYGIRYDEWSIVPNCGFRLIAYIVIFILYALVIFEKFENKKVLTIVCFVCIFMALGYFFAGLKPFVNGTAIYISKLLFFISYCAAVASINMGMDKEVPNQEYIIQ